MESKLLIFFIQSHNGYLFFFTQIDLFLLILSIAHRQAFDRKRIEELQKIEINLDGKMHNTSASRRIFLTIKDHILKLSGHLFSRPY